MAIGQNKTLTQTRFICWNKYIWCQSVSDWKTRCAHGHGFTPRTA